MRRERALNISSSQQGRCWLTALIGFPMHSHRSLMHADIHEAITDLTKRLKKLVKEMTAPKFDDGIARRPEVDDDDFIPEFVH